MPALAHSVSLKSLAAVLGGGRFSPTALFAASEQGFWYDPSDFTTMYQDSAGTTPVTAVEQPVGLVLDKRLGATFGPELITNGTFDTDATGWTANAGTLISVVDGRLRVTSDTARGIAYWAVTTVVGMSYRVIATAVAGTASGQVYVGTGVGTNTFGSTPLGGTGGVLFVATGTTTYISCRNSSATATTYCDYDNISVRELPGNHASQSTSASRPVLSARVNLLTYTEDFSNAVWVAGSNAIKAASSITNAGTSAVFVYQSGGTVPAVTHISSVELKKNTARYAQVQLAFSGGTHRYAVVIDLNDGSFVETADTSPPLTSKSYSITSVGDGWYRLAVSGNGPSGIGYIIIECTNGLPISRDASLNFTNATNGVSISVRKADLRPANAGVGLPAYQRVTTATDYDTTGFPYYLRFDGTDDGLSTSAIDFSATDKMAVFAGVRKLSDSPNGMLVELSSSFANPGTFALQAPWDSGSAYRFVSGGASFGVALPTDPSNAPVTNALTALGDISGDRATLRINGSQAAQSTSDQGTGNFGNYPLYIGRRGGSTLPFNGRLYSLIGLGRTATAAEIASTETWVNARTKAY